MLANAAEARGKAGPNATQSVAVILSMPPGSPPDRVEAAARTWAKETFGGKYDYLMARHDDTDHPHVHVTVRAVGYDGKRLAPGPADLQQYRERFAHQLRRQGVEAEATPRQARGHVRKANPIAVHHAERRGVEPRVRTTVKRDAEREAAKPKPLPRTIGAGTFKPGKTRSSALTSAMRTNWKKAPAPIASLRAIFGGSLLTCRLR